MMRFLSFVLILLITTPIIAQNKVYFPYFELINIEKDPGLQYSSSKLIKTYIENNHAVQLVLPERVNEEYYQTPGFEDAMASAKNISATYLMIGEIHILDRSYIVSVGLYETATGTKVWHDLIKGLSEEDLDPLLTRLGRSFLSKTTAKEDVEIDEVTLYEQQGVELMQIHVNHFVGAMLGGMYLFNEHTISGFGLSYTYDATSVLFNMNFEFYPTSNLLQPDDEFVRKFRHGNFNLGVMVPLSRKRMSWYLHGGMDYGIVHVRRIDPELRIYRSGVGFFAGAGYLINRNSTVNLRIFTAVSLPTYLIDNQYMPSVKFGIVTSFSKR